MGSSDKYLKGYTIETAEKFITTFWQYLLIYLASFERNHFGQVPEM